MIPMTTRVRGLISTIFSATLVNITVLISGMELVTVSGSGFSPERATAVGTCAPTRAKSAFGVAPALRSLRTASEDRATLVGGQMLQRIGSDGQCIVSRRTG